MNKKILPSLKDPIIFLATGFGSGRIPKFNLSSYLIIPSMPGTWGSIVAFLLAILIAYLGGIELLLIITLIIFVLSIPIVAWHQRKSDQHDMGEVVIDEFVGLWITLLLIPFNFEAWFLGLLFFRIIDIWKPFPIGWCDKNIKNSFGVIFDDVLAGIYAAGLILFIVALIEGRSL